MRELSGTQSRQIIDCEQVYMEWRRADRDRRLRFAGSIAWKLVKGRRYLYRKTADSWKSLGPESLETRNIHDRFHTGRAANRLRCESLNKRIMEMAPANRAIRLGRVPLLSARILRRLDRIGVLGEGLSVAGTHALYAYERMAGVQFGEDFITTQDIDLLYDARGGLDLIGSNLAETGLVGILRSIDSSFEPTELDSFRAANADGFLVDLIVPATRKPAHREFRQKLGDDPTDLSAVEIAGLGWLESCPKVEQIAIDERGFPLLIIVPDPRAFACHKLWLSRRDDRDPLKRRRDLAQAHQIAEALIRYLPNLRFDDPTLAALPLELRQYGLELAETARRRSADLDGETEWF